MDIPEGNRLFRQLGFTKEFSFLLNTDEQTFRDCFNDNVSDDVNFFVVSGHKKNFHGRIRAKTFDIYRPTKFVNNADDVPGTKEHLMITCQGITILIVNSEKIIEPV
jgi:hypothetical protein